jgi:hypothetical protein
MKPNSSNPLNPSGTPLLGRGRGRYLFPQDYMADPSANVFNGRLYIYPSHDWDSGASEDDDGGHFEMKDYHVLSLDDVENGEVTGIDPCVFRDDDGQIYIYFGGIWGGQLQRYKDNKALPAEHLPAGDEVALPSRVVRMTDDVLQHAEEPKPVLVVDADGNPLKASDPHRFFEASWMHKYHGLYYFSYSTGDTHLLCYATGTSPYGPFTYRGVLLEPVVGWTTHHSIVEYKGHWYLFHHDCVPSNGITWLRSLKVKELYYDEQGDIKVKD